MILAFSCLLSKCILYWARRLDKICAKCYIIPFCNSILTDGKSKDKEDRLKTARKEDRENIKVPI